ncbi:sulfotransferase [Hyphobacterium sp. HN65]|uniref:Sulfotransferase n=1 Tax=Hyphobacterium lacteum TaxID=3116575 RepID=A0ABU7LME1_9PROT|nr:sulfotransferase [Hyphobacterium sp. HN65]MEE2525095.1 sulfotransferase [Hyphobacterium sp. HN65]
MTVVIEETLKSLPRLLSRGDWTGARHMAADALRAAPGHPDLNAFAAFIALRMDDRDSAIDYARTAAKAGNTSPRATAQAANILAQLRLFDKALKAARALDLQTVRDPVVLDQAGAAFTACEAHEEAEHAYRLLVALAPGNPQCLFNLAAAQRFTGKSDEAACNFDQVIAAQPGRGEAWYARALIRKATPSDNRVDRIRKVLSQGKALPGMERASLAFALGKELEDIGRYDEAFEAWGIGARLMRELRPYSPSSEIQAIDETVRQWAGAKQTRKDAGLAPVFIVSLPRSGSTLVDRILSSHPSVTSLGETEDFIVSLLGAPEMAGAHDAVTLARKTAEVDIEKVGQRYREALLKRGHKTGVVIDKTPTNFLYAGLIAEALPEARIIHVTRDPRDSAIATYKTLFRDRYFWSYDIGHIADYVVAKTRLTEHWCTNWPERMVTLSYEDLVASTEAEARRLVAAIGLEWNAACLDFAANRTAVSTASADQVRQPVYDSSVGYWKNFEHHLEPAIEIFTAAGLV